MSARALTIAHVDAESGFSGGEVQVSLLAAGLAQRGHRCVLVCPPDSGLARRGRELGLAVREIAMRNELDAVAIAVLKRAFTELAPDLVHLHTGRANWLGGWAARLAGVPAITTRRMDREVSHGMRTRIVYEWLTLRTVAISEGVVECLRAGGVPEQRIELIPSSVDPSAVVPRRTRAEVRAELGASAEDSVVLAAGALVRRKGFDVLLEACAELARSGSEPRVWIAGEGEERAALEAQRASLGLESRVRLLGERHDVPDLLGACDVFAMPSRREGLGVAALEAMCAGRPVVASAVGGLREAVIDGECGFLVEPGDAPGLARALARILSDARLAQDLGRGGRERVRERYLAEQMVEAYEALYRRVLA
jgi:glycosyltransferase involved in cell wall biosynthesis